MNREKLNLLCIQEHRFSFQGDSVKALVRQVEGKTFTFFLSSAIRGVGGVGVILAPDVQSLCSVESLTPRCMKVKYAISPSKVIELFCVHAPTAAHPAEQLAFLTFLEKQIRSLPHPLIIGDLNAVLLPHDDGPFGSPARCAASPVRTAARINLLSFLHSCRFTSTLTHHRQSFSSHAKRATLDHILCLQRHKRCIVTAKCLPGPLPSDHRPVVCELCVTWEIHLPPPRPPRPV